MDKAKTVTPIERSASEGDYIAGLEGVVAAQTCLSKVDGLRGELTIMGFPVEAIAGRASFEELVYLLWHGCLPDRTQLGEFRAALAAQRDLSTATLEVLQAASQAKVSPMAALRMAAGTLDLPSRPGDDRLAESSAILARIATISAAYWRMSQSQPPVEPRPDLGHAANYLYMLTGNSPESGRVRGLETYLNTVIDHGLNASTFTARVITSTGSDLVSAIVGAIGALKGPLHGGAPGPALDMVYEIGRAERAEAYLRAKLERKERIMGFGHRVYRVRDPRADVLATAAEQFYQQAGDRSFYQLARQVERTAVALLAEYYPGRNLQTNVEFYTALLLQGLGLPVELFSPTFAVSRTAGWLAHCQEQARQNRLIRPQSEYIGPSRRPWVPLEDR
jgi:citrate synthase